MSCLYNLHNSEFLSSVTVHFPSLVSQKSWFKHLIEMGTAACNGCCDSTQGSICVKQLLCEKLLHQREGLKVPVLWHRHTQGLIGHPSETVSKRYSLENKHVKRSNGVSSTLYKTAQCCDLVNPADIPNSFSVLKDVTWWWCWWVNIISIGL